MKKLLITTGIISVIALVGCTTPHHHAKGDNPHAHAHKYHKHGKHKGTFQTFQCESGAKVSVHGLPKQDAAMLHIHAPSWNLSGEHIKMTAAPAASGERFINESNPASKYSWHSKGNIGVLSVELGGKSHSLNCEEVAPEFPANHPKAPRS